MDRWPIFLCYRQADGGAAAARIFALLHDQPVPMPEQSDPKALPPQLDIYFDQAAPGVGDWQAVHEPYLKRARAMIVVCTPGAKLNEGKNDWVHREIDWWLANREMAPILVDPLGADLRYVPSSIAARWPNAQRIRLGEKDWESLSDKERKSVEERVRAQFLGAIVPSAARFYREELELGQRQVARITRIRRASLGLAASLIAVLATAVWIYFLKGAADDAALKAIAAQRDAEQASELAQTRVLEGQLAHTRTEAELLGILQQFEKYKAYRDTLRQWQEEFRTRATTLEATANQRLPMCNVRARFSVYERQLIKARLEDLGKDEALFAYLAVIPGSSPRLGDWAPAVLDVFFAPSNVVSVGRNLERGAIKRIMETVPIESRAGFLVGLGTPLVLTHAGKNYRIKMTNIAMNDDGDMAMSFELCEEGGA